MTTGFVFIVACSLCAWYGFWRGDRVGFNKGVDAILATALEQAEREGWD